MYVTALTIPTLPPDRAARVVAALDEAVAALRDADTGFVRAALLRRSDGSCVLDVAWESEARLRSFLASEAARRVTGATASLFALEGARAERVDVLWSTD